jgi:hypothetical protein
MAARHGTRTRYGAGCRCDDCVAANSSYQADYRQRRITGSPIAVQTVADLPPSGPGHVESAVKDEIAGLAAEARPGLAQTALALARLMDNPKAINQYAAAAKVLVQLLDELGKAGAPRRRSHLALVREMTEKKGGA